MNWFDDDCERIEVFISLALSLAVVCVGMWLS
jgi:hypothetical protein